jgi:hypothetical protein
MTITHPDRFDSKTLTPLSLIENRNLLVYDPCCWSSMEQIIDTWVIYIPDLSISACMLVHPRSMHACSCGDQGDSWPCWRIFHDVVLIGYRIFEFGIHHTLASSFIGCAGADVNLDLVRSAPACTRFLFYLVCSVPGRVRLLFFSVRTHLRFILHVLVS